MTGSLLTTAVDKPGKGQELRTANLVFTVGSPAPVDLANQIVLGGVAAYDIAAPTTAVRSATVRPVMGGSGRYEGARGWCRSVHYADGSWRHVFHLRLR